MTKNSHQIRVSKSTWNRITDDVELLGVSSATKIEALINGWKMLQDTQKSQAANAAKRVTRGGQQGVRQ